MQPLSLTPNPPKRRPSSAATTAHTAPRKEPGSARYHAMKQAAADEKEMLSVALTEAKSATSSDLTAVDVLFNTPGFAQQTRRRRLASPQRKPLASGDVPKKKDPQTARVPLVTPALEITVESLLKEMRLRKMREAALEAAVASVTAKVASLSPPVTPSHAGAAAAAKRRKSSSWAPPPPQHSVSSASQSQLLLLPETASFQPLVAVDITITQDDSPHNKTSRSVRSPTPSSLVTTKRSPPPRTDSPVVPAVIATSFEASLGVSPNPFFAVSTTAPSRPASRNASASRTSPPHNTARRRSTAVMSAAAGSRTTTPLPGGDRPLRFGRSKSLASGRELLSEARSKYKQLLLDAKRTNAAVVLQRWFQRNRLRWTERRVRKAQQGIAVVFSRCILRFVCKVRAKRTARLAREAALRDLTAKQRDCALTIQRYVRMFLGKRRASVMREARARSYRYRAWMERRRFAVYLLVRWFRGRVLSRAIDAARAANAARQHDAFLEAARVNVLVTRGRRTNRANANRHGVAAVLIQSVYRGHRVRLRVRAYRSLLKQQLPPVYNRVTREVTPLRPWLLRELVSHGRRW